MEQLLEQRRGSWCAQSGDQALPIALRRLGMTAAGSAVAPVAAPVIAGANVALTAYELTMLVKEIMAELEAEEKDSE